MMRRLLPILLVFLLASMAQVSWGAWGANMRCELRSGSGADHGGGFDGGTTPVTHAALVTFTGAMNSRFSSTAGTKTITDPDAQSVFTTAMIGHALVITAPAAGAASYFRPAVYTILTRPDANTITVDMVPAPYGVNATGGIGTVSPGYDYSQQAEPPVDSTSVVTATQAAPTVLTATTGTFPADCMGNLVYLSGGTGGTVTTGWYEIITYTNSTTVTIDRTCAPSAATVTAVTCNLGGALNPTTLWDTFLENAVPGVKVWAQGPGTFTVTTNAVAIAANGSTTLPIAIEGYQATRGDAPTGANRPTINAAALAWSLGTFWNLSNLICTGAGTTVSGFTWAASAYPVSSNCKFLNTQTGTASRSATIGPAGSRYIGCEFSSPVGFGLNFTSNAGVSCDRCWFRDSTVGVSTTTAGGSVFSDCVFDTCGTGMTATTGLSRILRNCTWHNCPTAISATGAAYAWLVENNVFAYNGTSISWSDALGPYLSSCLARNNWYGQITADTSYAGRGIDDTAWNPGFLGENTWSDLATVKGSKVVTSVAGGFSAYWPNANMPMGVYLTGTAANHWVPGYYTVTASTDTSLTLSAVCDDTVANGVDGTARRCIDFRPGPTSLVRDAGANLTLGVTVPGACEQGAYQYPHSAHGWGTATKDAAIYHTQGASQRITPTSTVYKALSTARQIACIANHSTPVVAWVRESVVGDGTDYNGARIRLVVLTNTDLGITADTLISTATVASEGAWQRLGGNITPTATGYLSAVVDCDGTTGWANVEWGNYSELFWRGVEPAPWKVWP